MQKRKNLMCYKCGKQGHYADQCPSGDNNDDKASTRSNSSLLSNRSNHRRSNALDGVASMMVVSHYSKGEA
jgi:hypothetical protein